MTNGLILLALLAGLKMQQGPGELRFGNLSVRLPKGCEGSITHSIDAILGVINCGTLRIGVFGPPGDPCEPCGFDARPRCARESASRALVTLEQGGQMSVCAAEWAKGDVQLALTVRRGLTFWAKPRTPTEVAMCFEIASSIREVPAQP